MKVVSSVRATTFDDCEITPSSYVAVASNSLPRGASANVGIDDSPLESVT